MKKFGAIVISMLMLAGLATQVNAAAPVTCWFPPGWKAKEATAKKIVQVLTHGSGILIHSRIAKNYPEILAVFSTDKKSLVYVGSFAQAVIKARGLGIPLVQSINGKELYAGILVYPKGENPEEILKQYPEEIAYAVGASSGESSAKAATNGRAAIGTPSHGFTCAAVKTGKAKAGFVKNWWWEKNHNKYPMLTSYLLPGISITKNPDNVLTASKAMPADMRERIRQAAIAGKDAFNATEMEPFDPTRLDFSLELMKKGKIDPLTYSWK